MRDTTVKYLIVGMCSVLLGIGTGFGLSYLLMPPKTASIIDLNNDQRKDILIRTKGRESYILMQQEDGSYVSLDEYINSKKREASSESKSKLEEELRAVESEKRDIEVEATLH